MSYNRSDHTPTPDQQYVPMAGRTVRTEVTRDECNGARATYQQAFNEARAVVDTVPPPGTERYPRRSLRLPPRADEGHRRQGRSQL